MLGGGGFLGRALVKLLAQRTPVDAPRSSRLDVRDRRALTDWCDARPPRAVVNLAAARPSESMERLRDVNVAGAANVAALAADRGLRIVHVSSDMVFDGCSPPYDEDAVTRPTNSYGRSKAAGEDAVFASGAAAVVVRTSLIWDALEMSRGVLAFAERLARGEPCRLYTDEFRCPVTRDLLAAAISFLIDMPYTGPLHVSGAESLSRFEFGSLLLEHFRVPGRERAERALAGDGSLPPGEERPRNLTLDVSRAAGLLSMEMTGAHAALEAS